MTENNYPTFNGVSILSSKPSKDTKSSTSTYMYEGTTKYTSIAINSFGISFVLENKNASRVDVSLFFNKIQKRDKDGVLLDERTPIARVSIPPNERVIATLNLGTGYPMNEDDIRLKNIHLEYLQVDGHKSNLLSLLVYTPSSLTQYSTIADKRLKRLFTWLLLSVFPLSGLINGYFDYHHYGLDFFETLFLKIFCPIVFAFCLHRAFIHTFKKTYFSDFA